MNKRTAPEDDVAGAPQREAMLAVLAALDSKAHTNQRSVASRAGVALGLANSLIKRCVHKGLVKISQAPARRYAYYLTPEGFAEKSRLVAEYLAVSLDFFRQARIAYAELFSDCEQRGWRRVVLAGGGELAEIALLAVADRPIEFVVIDEERTGSMNGWPVVASLQAAGAIDGAIISDTKNPQRRYAEMIAQLGRERVLAPGFLQLSTEPPTAETAAAR